MNVEKASLIFQIDGKMYTALTDGIDLNLLVNRMAPLYEGGSVRMVELPPEIHFESYNRLSL